MIGVEPSGTHVDLSTQAAQVGRGMPSSIFYIDDSPLVWDASMERAMKLIAHARASYLRKKGRIPAQMRKR